MSSCTVVVLCFFKVLEIVFYERFWFCCSDVDPTSEDVEKRTHSLLHALQNEVVRTGTVLVQ